MSLAVTALFLLATSSQDAPPVVTGGPATAEEIAQIAALSPARRGDWRVAWRAPDAVMALDVGNVERRGATRTVWTASTRTGLGPVPGAYVMLKMELDCEARTARAVWFTVRMPSGDTVYGLAPPEGHLPYDNGSGGAAVAAAVCEDAGLSGPGFETHQAFAFAQRR